MNRDTRIAKISEILEKEKGNPYGRQDVQWKDALKTMNVYKIPLEYLIYNKYNGRILSRTKSLETQGKNIDPESTEGMKLIEELLNESNLSRNKQTLESIKKIGQQKVGIITKDGIIIDGNRRALLLKTAGSDYFKAVVLDATLEDNPIEIEKLETIYQMGEDEKLGYNAIEKYLKAKGLKEKGIKKDKIASWMGEPETKVTEYLDVMEVMDDYLKYLRYDGIYTQLYLREDPFINLTKWLKTFYRTESNKGFGEYTDDDVDDLRNISYDYIRARFEGKNFRIIADGLKPNHFFSDKSIWKSFCEFHFKHMDAIKDQETDIDYNSENLQNHLNARDNDFIGRTKTDGISSFLEENIKTHEQQLENKKSAAQPLKLVNNAISALDAIDQRHREFTEPKVMEKVESINKLTRLMLKKDTADDLLSQVTEILESINVEKDVDIKDKLLDKVKNIQKLAYIIEKNIKWLK